MVDRIATNPSPLTSTLVDPSGASAVHARYARFSSQPGLDAQAAREVLGGAPVEIAGVPNLVRWAARAIGRSLDNLSAGVSQGHLRGHFQRLARHPGRTLFRKPREVPDLLDTALREARDVAARNGDALAEGRRVQAGRTAVEQGGDRLVVEHDFGRAVGTQGETSLRIVLGRGGNIATAYPVRSLGAGAFFGVVGLGEDRANAMYDRFDGQVRRTADEVLALRRQQDRPNLLNEVIGLLDPTGIFYAEPANGSEDIFLATHRGAEQAIADIEAELGRSLDQTERQIYTRRFVDAVHTSAALREE